MMLMCRSKSRAFNVVAVFYALRLRVYAERDGSAVGMINHVPFFQRKTHFTSLIPDK